MNGAAGSPRFVYPGNSFVDFSYNLVGYQQIGNDYANSSNGAGWSSQDVDHVYTNNVTSEYIVSDLIHTFMEV